MTRTKSIELWSSPSAACTNGSRSRAEHAPRPACRIDCEVAWPVPDVHSPAAVDLMAIGRDPLRFAEACSRHDVDIEGGFFASLGFKNHPRGIRASWRDRFGAFAEALGAR